jgi:nitrous oxidase accessory protein NosD
VAATVGFALLALLAFVPAASAAKHKIDVRPGSSTIADAIDRVEEGGVIRVHRGRFREAVTIEKSVKLVGVGRGRPVIDARCADPSTVEVRADDVRLSRLKVIGANVANEVDFTGVSGGRVRDVVVKDTCDAEYGINVFDTGPLTIAGSRALGFHDAGFYIGEISATPGGSITLRDSESYANNRGVIVENSAGGDIRVVGNTLHHNDLPGFGGPVGILVNASDGVRIHDNESRANGAFGLQLTAESGGNVVTGNTILGNPVDIANDGTGNCGSDNTFATGDPLPPC